MDIKDKDAAAAQQKTKDEEAAVKKVAAKRAVLIKAMFMRDAAAAKKAASAVQGAAQKAEAAAKKAAAEAAANGAAAQQKNKDEEAAVKKAATRRAYWQRKMQSRKQRRSRASEESAAETRPCWIPDEQDAEAEEAKRRQDAEAEEAKRRRRGRGIDVRLSDARLADLDEVCKRLRKLLQSLAAQRGKRGRGRWRRKDSGNDSEGPSAGAESEPLHGQPPGHVADALMVQAPGEADGSFLTAPGEVFASLAVAHLRRCAATTMRRHLRRAQAWVRLRELVRKAGKRRCDFLGFGLWFHALVYRRRRLAGDNESGILVRLQHPEKMGSEWGVDIIVFRSETVASCKAYALALLARCWTSASVRKEAIKGHRLMVMIGGQDVALDHSRTLAQSGILAGSTLKLKSTGLLGGMPTGHPEPAAARAPAESAAPAPAMPLHADAQGEVAQRHAKLCMDVSGLIRKGKFGGIDLFDSMLEEQVGYMDATALRGMYAEHCIDAASSNAPFSPPNNPSLVCTPEREFYYVVGEGGIDIAKWEVKPGARPAKYDGCMVEGRNATPLSELLQADEAKRAKLRDTELIALRLYSGKKSFLAGDTAVLSFRFCCICHIPRGAVTDGASVLQGPCTTCTTPSSGMSIPGRCHQRRRICIRPPSSSLSPGSGSSPPSPRCQKAAPFSAGSQDSRCRPSSSSSTSRARRPSFASSWQKF